MTQLGREVELHQLSGDKIQPMSNYLNLKKTYVNIHMLYFKTKDKLKLQFISILSIAAHYLESTFFCAVQKSKVLAR